MRGTEWNSAKARLRSCTSVRITLCTSKVRGWPDGKHLCREGPANPGGQQVNHEPAVCFHAQEGQCSPGVHRVWLAGWGRLSCPSALSWWGRIWSTVSSSGLPSARKTRDYWREYSGGLQRWSGGWSISLKKRGWETWVPLAWRKEIWEGIWSILINI